MLVTPGLQTAMLPGDRHWCSMRTRRCAGIYAIYGGGGVLRQATEPMQAVPVDKVKRHSEAIASDAIPVAAEVRRLVCSDAAPTANPGSRCDAGRSRHSALTEPPMVER